MLSQFRVEKIKTFNNYIYEKVYNLNNLGHNCENSPNILNDLEKTLNEIHIINKYSLEKFDFKNSYYRINYSGDPKKLSEDFLSFNYLLRDNQGTWELVKK